VTDLEQQPHHRRQRDALVTGQRQHLVVVHHRVQRLDPHRIDVAVENDPFRTLTRQVGQVPHDDREQTCAPATKHIVA